MTFLAQGRLIPDVSRTERRNLRLAVRGTNWEGRYRPSRTSAHNAIKASILQHAAASLGFRIGGISKQLQHQQAQRVGAIIVAVRITPPGLVELAEHALKLKG